MDGGGRNLGNINLLFDLGRGEYIFIQFGRGNMKFIYIQETRFEGWKVKSFSFASQG